MRKLILFIACLMSLQANAQNADINWRNQEIGLDCICPAGIAKRDSLLALKYPNQEIEQEKEQNKRKNYLVKRYGSSVAKKLMDERVWLGMTDKMVDDEFGPAEVKRSVSTGGVVETWFYLPDNSNCIGSGCPVLYYSLTFKNHKLIALTDL